MTGYFSFYFGSKTTFLPISSGMIYSEGLIFFWSNLILLSDVASFPVDVPVLLSSSWKLSVNTPGIEEPLKSKFIRGYEEGSRVSEILVLLFLDKILSYLTAGSCLAIGS